MTDSQYLTVWAASILAGVLVQRHHARKKLIKELTKRNAELMKAGAELSAYTLALREAFVLKDEREGRLIDTLNSVKHHVPEQTWEELTASHNTNVELQKIVINDYLARK